MQNPLSNHQRNSRLDLPKALPRTQTLGERKNEPFLKRVERMINMRKPNGEKTYSKTQQVWQVREMIYALDQPINVKDLALYLASAWNVSVSQAEDFVKANYRKEA